MKTKLFSTKFVTIGLVAAIGVSLVGCSKTAEPAVEAANAKNATTAPGATAPAAAKVQTAEKPSGGFSLPFTKPKTVTVTEGTPLQVRTDATLSTKTAQTGETFTATLTEPVIVNGKVVAPRGSRVEGKVVDSDDGGRVKGVASISVRLTQLRVGSNEVAISTGTVAREAQTSKKSDAVKVGVGAGIGAAIGAIAGGGRGAAIGAASGGAAGTGVVLATHGKPAEIPAESVLTFSLTAPVTVEPAS